MTKKRLQAYQKLISEKKQLEDLLAAGETEALRSCYREKIAQVEQEQLAIEQAIDSLEPKERLLMRHRYIEGLKWEEICVLLHYEWRQIHNIHRGALEKIREQ